MAMGVVQEALWAFLRVDASQVSGIFLNDIVNLIILPSIILLIFLDFAVCQFMKGQTKMRVLLEVAFFLVIIVQGWYGPFATFAANYMIIFLIFALILFAVTRFIKPSEAGGLSNSAGKYVGNIVAKQKEEKEIKIKLLEQNSALYEVNQNLMKPNLSDHERGALRARASEIQNNIFKLNERLRNL